jgi:hypothetical protein
MSYFKKYDEFIFEERRGLIFNNRNVYSDDDKHILAYIKMWIDQKTPSRESDRIAEFLFNSKKILKILSTKKPDVYSSPIGLKCYRGLEKVSNMKQVIDSIKRGRFKREKAPGYDDMIDSIKIENYDYFPKRLAQSWSIDPDVPWRFSNSGIILETTIDEDFIMNPNFTSEINRSINRSGASSGLNEEEVIHLGNKYNKVDLYIDLGSIDEDDELYTYLKDII